MYCNEYGSSAWSKPNDVWTRSDGGLCWVLREATETTREGPASAGAVEWRRRHMARSPGRSPWRKHHNYCVSGSNLEAARSAPSRKRAVTTGSVTISMLFTNNLYSSI